MERKFALIFAVGALLFGMLACGAPTSDVVEEAASPQAEAEVSEAEVILPTEAPAPTDIPEPTSTPEPTATPEPPPEPIFLSGTGDSILNIEKPDLPMLAMIKGNSCSRYFGISNLNENNESIALLVNTTDPYEGIVPLDFLDYQWTKRFEVQSNCEWEISVVPLSEGRTLTVPGAIQGTGDEVFLLDGETPDLIHVVGNRDGRYFGVTAYSDWSDLVVNTTDPYDGTSILSEDVAVIEVQAVGEWQIEISSK